MPFPVPPAKPVRTVTLHLSHHSTQSALVDEALRENLSALELTGNCLWTASDETAQIERLVTRGNADLPEGRYGEHAAFALADLFDLPEGAEGEVDLEGLALEGHYLWLTGSMAYARKKPNPGENDTAKALERLSQVKRDPNRWLLGRVPCTKGADGTWSLHREVRLADGTHLTAGCLKFSDKHGNVLTKALRTDEHLARFLEVPAKENGFDVEGVCAFGGRRGVDTVFLGLRGPVLRGWAVLLELELEATKPGRLTPRPLGAEEEPYRKHFLDLDGLGIRDLKRSGDDLLILAGPTMDLDGPVQIWRWKDAVHAGAETVIPRTRLEMVLQVPHGYGFDHAEGFCLMPGGRQVMVTYDNPGPGRLHRNEASVDLDVFDLPQG